MTAAVEVVVATGVEVDVNVVWGESLAALGVIHNVSNAPLSVRVKLLEQAGQEVGIKSESCRECFPLPSRRHATQMACPQERGTPRHVLLPGHTLQACSRAEIDMARATEVIEGEGGEWG